MSVVLALALRFLASKTGRIILLVLAGAAAFGAYTLYERHQGYVGALEKYKAASEAEHARREAVLVAAQESARASVGRVKQLEEYNVRMQAEIAKAQVGVPARDCLDSGAVERLQRAGRPPGNGTR